MARYGMTSGHVDNSADILPLRFPSHLCHEQLHIVYEVP